MIRPRLRSKTGCHVCRLRRKKCDEVKPVCRNCCRSNYRCKYSVTDDSHQDQASGVSNSVDAGLFSHRIKRVAATLEGRVTGLLTGYNVFGSQVEFDLVMTTPALLRSTINQPCGPQSRDFSCWMTIALGTSWLRPTFATHAAIMLSMEHPSERLMGLQQYHKSIDQLRLKLMADINMDDLLSLVVCTFILGHVEVHGFARPSFAIAHFVACAQLLQHTIPKTIVNAEKPVRSMYRTAAETCLYVIASLSMFHPAPQTLFAVMDWSFLSTALDSPHHRSQRSLQLPSQRLAELSSFNNVNRMLLIVMVLSREQDSSRDRHDKLRLIQQEIDVSESQLPLWYGTDVSEDARRAFCFRWRASICGLRIIVEKLLDPLVCSATPTVRDNLQKCINNITMYAECLRSRPELTWPSPYPKHALKSNQNITTHWLFLVIAAAAYTAEELDFVLPFLAKPKAWGSSTHFTQIQNFISLTRFSHQQLEKDGCKGERDFLHGPCHDGLDRLIAIGGPFSSNSDENG